MNLSIQQKFTSQDNKRILWEIMTEHNVFKGISGIYVNNVKKDFERTVKTRANSIIDKDDILSLNKQVIMNMVEEVKKYIPANVPAHVNGPITSQEALTKKQEKFQRGLESKQEEFNTLIQPPKPPVIDFSDKLDDDPIGSEMDIKLAETIAWREKQLSQVLEKQDTTKATDWIKNGKQELTNTINNQDTNTHIKIGQPTSIDDIINIKKVSFSENSEMPIQTNNTMQSNNIQLTFMDKLKKKDINEEVASLKVDIKNLLEQNKLILENQEKIINLLVNNK
jgi:hypothetical protein